MVVVKSTNRRESKPSHLALGRWLWCIGACALVGFFRAGLLLGETIGSSGRGSLENLRMYSSRLWPTAKPDYDAVIVGAGWAGIRAAKKLLDEGVTNILVLEANDYIGGRSKTVNTDGSINVPNPSNVSHSPIDMGSEWLYLKNNDEMKNHLIDNGHLRDDGHATFVPIQDSPFYMQSVSDDGTVETTRMDDTVLNELHERVWGGFMSFRKKLLRKEGDQSYSSK